MFPGLKDISFHYSDKRWITEVQIKTKQSPWRSTELLFSSLQTYDIEKRMRGFDTQPYAWLLKATLAGISSCKSLSIKATWCSVLVSKIQIKPIQRPRLLSCNISTRPDSKRISSSCMHFMKIHIWCWSCTGKNENCEINRQALHGLPGPSYILQRWCTAALPGHSQPSIFINHSAPLRWTSTRKHGRTHSEHTPSTHTLVPVLFLPFSCSAPGSLEFT